MARRIIAETEKLNSVTATIVEELGAVGVFHYNKLTYLFEYFFIKNFGVRYTKEPFVKLPHGPVISNYKKQIASLTNNKIISTDLDELNADRKLDDDIYIKIQIDKTEKTDSESLKETLIRGFLLKIIEKYATLDVSELEKIVYKTLPLQRYEEQVTRGFKNNTGGYVLDNNGIKMADYTKNPSVTARKRVYKHIEKFPKIDEKQMQKFAEEFSFLEKFRPKWGNH